MARRPPTREDRIVQRNLSRRLHTRTLAASNQMVRTVWEASKPSSFADTTAQAPTCDAGRSWCTRQAASDATQHVIVASRRTSTAAAAPGHYRISASRSAAYLRSSLLAPERVGHVVHGLRSGAVAQHGFDGTSRRTPRDVGNEPGLADRLRATQTQDRQVDSCGSAGVSWWSTVVFARIRSAVMMSRSPLLSAA